MRAKPDRQPPLHPTHTSLPARMLPGLRSGVWYKWAAVSPFVDRQRLSERPPGFHFGACNAMTFWVASRDVGTEERPAVGSPPPR